MKSKHTWGAQVHTAAGRGLVSPPHPYFQTLGPCGRNPLESYSFPNRPSRLASKTFEKIFWGFRRLDGLPPPPLPYHFLVHLVELVTKTGSLHPLEREFGPWMSRPFPQHPKPSFHSLGGPKDLPVLFLHRRYPPKI